MQDWRTEKGLQPYKACSGRLASLLLNPPEHGVSPSGLLSNLHPHRGAFSKVSVSNSILLSGSWMETDKNAARGLTRLAAVVAGPSTLPPSALSLASVWMAAAWVLLPHPV